MCTVFCKCLNPLKSGQWIPQDRTHSLTSPLFAEPPISLACTCYVQHNGSDVMFLYLVLIRLMALNLSTLIAISCINSHTLGFLGHNPGSSSLSPLYRIRAYVTFVFFETQWRRLC